MEYEGKELFNRFGIPTPRGLHASSVADVESFIAANPRSWVIESQVLIAGRGKAAGIKFADSAARGAASACELIGKVLKNAQNPDREAVRSLLVEEKVQIASEAYVSITIDRAAKKPVVIVTAQGGMDVEEVAAHDPAAISKYWIDPAIGFQPFEARNSLLRRSCPPASVKRFRRCSAACTTFS